MTLQKALIGALTALLLLTGFSSQALAQDTNDNTTTTDPTATTTPDTTTMTDGTTPDTTTTTDPTTTTEGQGTGNIGESFATDTPNPQPSAPLPTAEDPAAAPSAEQPAAAQTTAEAASSESQLAFTGPDTRVIALAMLLLGAGFVFAMASRRQERRLAEVESWLK